MLPQLLLQQQLLPDVISLSLSLSLCYILLLLLMYIVGVVVGVVFVVVSQLPRLTILLLSLLLLLVSLLGDFCCCLQERTFLLDLVAIFLLLAALRLAIFPDLSDKSVKGIVDSHSRLGRCLHERHAVAARQLGSLLHVYGPRRKIAFVSYQHHRHVVRVLDAFDLFSVMTRKTRL